MGLVKWKRSLVWLLASLAISAILWVLLLSTISERVVDKKWMEAPGTFTIYCNFYHQIYVVPKFLRFRVLTGDCTGPPDCVFNKTLLKHYVIFM